MNIDIKFILSNGFRIVIDDSYNRKIEYSAYQKYKNIKITSKDIKDILELYNNICKNKSNIMQCYISINDKNIYKDNINNINISYYTRNNNGIIDITYKY